MLSRRASTISGIAYLAVVLVLTFFIGLSCALLLSQAVRNSPTRNWTKNFNAVVIGAAYAIVVSLHSYSDTWKSGETHHVYVCS